MIAQIDVSPLNNALVQGCEIEIYQDHTDHFGCTTYLTCPKLDLKNEQKPLQENAGAGSSDNALKMRQFIKE